MYPSVSTSTCCSQRIICIHWIMLKRNQWSDLFIFSCCWYPLYSLIPPWNSLLFVLCYQLYVHNIGRSQGTLGPIVGSSLIVVRWILIWSSVVVGYIFEATMGTVNVVVVLEVGDLSVGVTSWRSLVVRIQLCIWCNSIWGPSHSCSFLSNRRL